MKLFIFFTLITISLNSFAFFGLFEKKQIDPMSLKTYEERMDYLLNNDPVFKKYWTERKEKITDVYEKNLAELAKIEEEISESGKYSPEAIQKLQEENKKREKILFDQKMKEMEDRLLQEWAIIDGEFVNIKEYNEKNEKKRADNEKLRRVQQFQSEEGLPVSKDIESIRINVD